jgi:N12 class adenine-specific DNA methylase
MSPDKEKVVAKFRQSLMDHDVEFIEKANGHFQIFRNNTLVFQVWPTTEKILLSDGTTKVGKAIIKRCLNIDTETVFTEKSVDTPPWEEANQRMSPVRRNFIIECSSLANPACVVAAVQLPTGALEIITNTQHVKEKIQYYKERYDDNFRLITNPEVKIVGILII